VQVLSFFLTHPEVTVDPAIPVEQWSLSKAGRRRAHLLSGCAWTAELTRIISSEERKAVETAAILAGGLGLDRCTDAALGENDRSATGFLPPEEFEATADQFFAHPDRSVRGWETAEHAQHRVLDAVRSHLATGPGGIAFVAHGGVGTLLLCHLMGVPISRQHDQPGQGSYFAFDPAQWRAIHPWRRIGES
jgi:broad specificity phosphatase PhoE